MLIHKTFALCRMQLWSSFVASELVEQANTTRKSSIKFYFDIKKA